MKRIQVGSFIKYILDPSDVNGLYGLVFRTFTKAESGIQGQAVWFHEKRHWKKYYSKAWNGRFTNYSISGIVYNRRKKDCKLVAKPPKKVLKRARKALLYVLDQERAYIEPGKFTNLDMIEILAKVKNL